MVNFNDLNPNYLESREYQAKRGTVSWADVQGEEDELERRTLLHSFRHGSRAPSPQPGEPRLRRRRGCFPAPAPRARYAADVDAAEEGEEDWEEAYEQANAPTPPTPPPPPPPPPRTQRSGGGSAFVPDPHAPEADYIRFRADSGRSVEAAPLGRERRSGQPGRQPSAGSSPPPRSPSGRKSSARLAAKESSAGSSRGGEREAAPSPARQPSAGRSRRVRAYDTG